MLEEMWQASCHVLGELLNRCLNSDKVLLFKLPSTLASVHDVLPPVPCDYVPYVVLIEQCSVTDCVVALIFSKPHFWNWGLALANTSVVLAGFTPLFLVLRRLRLALRKPMLAAHHIESHMCKCSLRKRQRRQTASEIQVGVMHL